MIGSYTRSWAPRHFSTGNVRQRPSADGHEHDALAGIPRQGATYRRSASRHCARVHQKVDYMAGLVEANKSSPSSQRLAMRTISRDFCKVTPEALAIFQTCPHDLFGVGIDAVSAVSCYALPTTTESFRTRDSTGWGFPNAKRKSRIYSISRTGTGQSRDCWCAR